MNFKQTTPFLLAIAVPILLTNISTNRSYAAPPASPAPAAVTRPVDTSPNAVMETQLIAAINKYRTAAGIPALTLRAELAKAAHFHSQTMARIGEMKHIDPEGHNASDRVRSAGYQDFLQVGENIAMNGGYSDPVTQAVDDWMKSEGHRINIMNPNFTETGVGIEEKDGVFYFTQVFSCPRSGSDATGTNVSSTPSAHPNTADSASWMPHFLELVNNERRTHGLSELKLNTTLCSVAQSGSQSLAGALQANRTSPDMKAVTPLDRRLRDAKFIANGGVSENFTLGLRTPDQVVALWLQRGGPVQNNLLAPEITQIGFGYTTQADGDHPINAWSVIFAAQH